MDLNQDFEYFGDCHVCFSPMNANDAEKCSVCGMWFHAAICGDEKDGEPICNICVS